MHKRKSCIKIAWWRHSSRYEVLRTFFLPVERKKESEKDLSKKIKTKPVRRLAEQESEREKEEKRGEGWLGFTTVIALSVRTRKCVSLHSP